MSLAAQIAKHVGEIHFGENLTSSNLKDNMATGHNTSVFF